MLRLWTVVLFEMEELFDVFDCLYEEDFHLFLDRPSRKIRTHSRSDHFALWGEEEFLKRLRLHEDTASYIMREVRHLIINRINEIHATRVSLCSLQKYSNNTFNSRPLFCYFTYSWHDKSCPNQFRFKLKSFI